MRADDTSIIKYRTIGNSDPRGKSRVFFMCHPDDFNTYFEDIAKTILKIQENCAIWYYDPDADRSGEIPEKMLAAQLGEMQLIVIPVTRRLLLNESTTLSMVVPYAVKNHIPILPLMMDKGQEKLFAQCFGDIQFLVPGQDDPTAIPFEKKMEVFLSGVLIGDEAAQRVRDAFDAYIFLSYRKKDREYAQELMKLIHKNDQFRDIAIWYDEYLIPGENFNDAIRKALEMSNLFALVVTPSLLERLDGKPNYIMEHEYPAAVVSAKRILPAEMSETDHEQLRTEYKGIPECIDGRDTEALIDSLVHTFKDMALKKRDPEHNFLIGLAYLDGIDVEVNHANAVEMITEAAESGLIEAMKKLAVMYNTGKGVKRDRLTAIEWQEKIVDQLRNEYEGEKTEEKRHALTRTLMTLASAYIDILIPRNARELLLEVNELCYSVDSVAGRQDLLDCLKLLSEVDRYTGKNLYRNYEMAVKICKYLVKETNTIESRRELALCYGLFGTEVQCIGDIDEAREYCERSVSLCKSLVEESNSIDNMRALAQSYMLLGKLEFEDEDYDKAIYCYEQALDIRKYLAEEINNAESKRAVSEAYSRLGRTMIRAFDYDRAKSLLLLALEINKGLAEETESLDSKSDVMFNYFWLSNIERYRDNTEESRRYKEKYDELDQLIKEEYNRELSGHNITYHYDEYDDIIV